MKKFFLLFTVLVTGGLFWAGSALAAGINPEPASMLLVGLGLIGLASVGRKKLFKKQSRNK